MRMELSIVLRLRHQSAMLRLTEGWGHRSAGKVVCSIRCRRRVSPDVSRGSVA